MRHCANNTHFVSGQNLLYQMSNDDTAGFRHAGEISLTSDQLVTIETVRQALDQLMTKLDRVQAQWQQRHLQLSHTVQFGELEDAMKTVSVKKACCLIKC